MSATRRTVLLFADGGFVDRHPIGYAKRAVRRAGLKPIVVKYPTHNLPRAMRYSARAARRNPGSHALGFSAGGVIAQNLAARNLVKKAVSVGAPGDLVKWDINPSYFGSSTATSHWDTVPATKRERWRASPDRLYQKRGKHRKSLILHGRDDALVPKDQARELARLSGGRLHWTAGGHDRAGFKRATPRAIRYLTHGGRRVQRSR